MQWEAEMYCAVNNTGVWERGQVCSVSTSGVAEVFVHTVLYLNKPAKRGLCCSFINLCFYRFCAVTLVIQ